MEANGEAETFLDKIKPPRLEDAGLEDCALSPESINEAFLRAATAIRSLVSISDDEDEPEDRCVEDPCEDSSDILVGITYGVTAPSDACTNEKGQGLTEAPGDKVVIGGGGDAGGESDVVVGPGLPEGGEACVDGLQGLGIGEKSGGAMDEVAEDEVEGRKDEPILAETFV